MFELNNKEKERFDAWKELHDQECPFSRVNMEKNVYQICAIGGRFSYIFTPTGLGTTIEVECACKKGDYKIDLTDYDVW